MDINLVLPEGPGHCRVIFDFYFSDAERQRGAEHIEQSLAVADRIQREDEEISEEVQKGLASQQFDTGRYSVRREAAVHHFHRMLAEKLSGALA